MIKTLRITTDEFEEYFDLNNPSDSLLILPKLREMPRQATIDVLDISDEAWAAMPMIEVGPEPGSFSVSGADSDK